MLEKIKTAKIQDQFATVLIECTKQTKYIQNNFSISRHARLKQKAKKEKSKNKKWQFQFLFICITIMPNCRHTKKKYNHYKRTVIAKL